MKLMDSFKAGFGAYFGMMAAAITILFVIPCFACGGCTALTTFVGAAGNASKEQRAVEREKTLMPKSVEIEALLQAFDDNPISADSIYGNHLLTVEGGIVHKVDTNSFSGQHYIRLVRQGDEFGLKSLRCNLKSKDVAASINVNAPLNVRGVLMGKSPMSVQLDRCEVVQ